MLLPCLTCDILFDGHLDTREILQKALYQWLHQKSSPLSLNICTQQEEQEQTHQGKHHEKDETHTPVANKSPWQTQTDPKKQTCEFYAAKSKAPQTFPVLWVRHKVFQQIHVKDSLRFPWKISKKGTLESPSVCRHFLKVLKQLVSVDFFHRAMKQL